MESRLFTFADAKDSNASIPLAASSLITPFNFKKSRKPTLPTYKRKLPERTGQSAESISKSAAEHMHMALMHISHMFIMT
jgi:hypothetical protein